MTRTLTIRLPEEHAELLASFAAFDGVAVAHEIREAISMLLESKRHDPAFRERVQLSLERSREMLELLEGSGKAAAELAAVSSALDDPGSSGNSYSGGRNPAR